MTESCPDCGAPLFFNPELQVSECHRCGGYFFPEDINAAEQRALSLKNNSNPLDNLSGSASAEDTDVIDHDIAPEYVEEFIESPIYICNQCGAEIIINSTEASTFCLYCGCPTLVFSRISQTRKPNYIIPFGISRERALTAIQEQMRHSFFAPKAVRKVKLEDIHGIYIPYWLTDIDYEATANIELRKNESNYVYKGSKASYVEEITHTARCGLCSFKRITTDASYTLPNDFSKCLEPYNTNNIKPFNKNYLAGFYSDIANITVDEGKEDALERAEQMFDKEMERALKYDGGGKVASKVGTYQITNCDSAMFPAWFVTIRYQNTPYTIAVNGQTGKVNGILPVNYAKFTFITVLTALVIWTVTFLMTTQSMYIFIALGLVAMIGLFTLGAGIRKLKRIKKRLRQAKSSLVYCYVHKRQGADL